MEKFSKLTFIVIIFTILFLSCSKSDNTDSGSIPTVSTLDVTSIQADSAISGGSIVTDGGHTVTARGVCWSTGENPGISDSKTVDGTGAGTFISRIGGLTKATKYYVRAYATNEMGTAYGSTMTFTTISILRPTVTTTEVSEITSSSATAGGVVTDNGGSEVSIRGVCWSTSPHPTITDNVSTCGTGNGSFSTSISLAVNTTYYLRAYATNNGGTGYGNEVTFTTLNNTITDIDGNIYHYIRIGNHDWLVENLKTTRYRNGDIIPAITDSALWDWTNSGAWCVYNNDQSLASEYGYLYNFYAVVDDRKIAPEGWHVATMADYEELMLTVISGGNLKEPGTTHWLPPNSGVNNPCGFNALPGGYRIEGFHGLHEGTMFHIDNIDEYEYKFILGYNSSESSYLNAGSNVGCSVRCVRD